MGEEPPLPLAKGTELQSLWTEEVEGPSLSIPLRELGGAHARRSNIPAAPQKTTTSDQTTPPRLGPVIATATTEEWPNRLMSDRSCDEELKSTGFR